LPISWRFSRYAPKFRFLLLNKIIFFSSFVFRFQMQILVKFFNFFLLFD
jgi:hypothetical protein